MWGVFPNLRRSDPPQCRCPVETLCQLFRENVSPWLEMRTGRRGGQSRTGAGALRQMGPEAGGLVPRGGARVAATHRGQLMRRSAPRGGSVEDRG